MRPRPTGQKLDSEPASQGRTPGRVSAAAGGSSTPASAGKCPRGRRAWAVKVPGGPTASLPCRALRGAGLWRRGRGGGVMETPKCRACFQGGPPAPTPQRPACHCPLPTMPAHHTPGPGGQREGTTGEGGPCQLQSASASRLLWQREDGGGGAESFWKAGNVCPPSMEPNSSRSASPSQTHVTTQARGWS